MLMDVKFKTWNWSITFANKFRDKRSKEWQAVIIAAMKNDSSFEGMKEQDMRDIIRRMYA